MTMKSNLGFMRQQKVASVVQTLGMDICRLPEFKQDLPHFVAEKES
jgi:hypothetical protein